MNWNRIRLSRQSTHLLIFLFAVIAISAARYKHTYWQAPNSTHTLTYEEAMQLTQSGKIPFALEHEYKTGKLIGGVTYKDDIYPYNNNTRRPHKH